MANEEEDLYAKLRSLRARLTFLTLYPMPFDNERRLENLRKGIREIQDRIGQSEIGWQKFGF